MDDRFSTMATITITDADGRTIDSMRVLREDMTTTTGAYRIVRDMALDMVADALRAMLDAHRGQ